MPRQKFIVDKTGQLADVCRERGIPLTVQRRTVMEMLAGRDDHPSAEQVHAAVRERIPGISLTTVYRVLETFVQLGLARRVDAPGAKSRFDADASRHHHARCVSCGRIVDIGPAALPRIDLPMAQVDGFHLFDYTINYLGYCRRCS
jgi:Fur family peroxide stress response transcriptional regulator